MMNGKLHFRNSSMLPKLLVLVWLAAAAVDAFAPKSRPLVIGYQNNKKKEAFKAPLPATPARDVEDIHPSAKAAAPSWKRQLLTSLQNFFWPGAQADPSVMEPLPPGSLGCPFFGSDGFLSGNKIDGPGCFFKLNSEAEGHPSITKFYFMGGPVASVSGAKLHQQLSSMEFTHTEALSPTYNDGSDDHDVEDTANAVQKPSVFGNDNLMFERSKDQHAFLRRLVGKGFTATAMSKSFPKLLEMPEQRMTTLLSSRESDTIAATMETITSEYTMDITQKQILGLELPSHEIPLFRENMATWLGALYSPVANANIPWIIRHTPEYRARQYVEGKVQKKIDELLESGQNDGSVLSNMVFAVDEENHQKLTRKQIVQNALLLMITGSETSSGTLTLMMLLLGLHPDVYERLKEEQKDIQQRLGPELTLELLQEEHAPYLNAVMKETMRMGPLTGGFPKRATQTIVVDGQQIPKGWSIFNNIRLTHQLDPVTRLDDDSHMDVHRGFHPERWLSPETTPSDFIPYGTGPRYCIGAPLAELQMQLFLATLARTVASFDLAMDYSGMKPVVWNPSTVVPRPFDGVQLSKIVPLWVSGWVRRKKILKGRKECAIHF